MTIEKSMLSGSTPMLVLSLLKDSDKYGYEMITELAKRSDDTFHLKEGTLYPLLHTMEQNHYVKSYIKEAPTGRSRRYYKITKSGLNYLEKKRDEWLYFTDKVNMVLETAETGGSA